MPPCNGVNCFGKWTRLPSHLEICQAFTSQPRWMVWNASCCHMLLLLLLQPQLLLLLLCDVNACSYRAAYH